MSILDSIGGLSGGLGGSGGVGGSIPSNTSSASSAASNTINPSTSVSGTGSGGYFELGPFNPIFPGVQDQGAGAINRAPVLSSLIPNGVTGVFLLAGAFIAILFLLYRR